MNLLVISDLHISKKEQIDSFGWENTDFIEFLNNIIEIKQVDKVILNGDIYDLYHNSYKSIYKKNKEIFDYFSTDKFAYIKGNHDFQNQEGLNEYNITNSSGKTIHIEHGHDVDFIDGTRIGRWISRFGYDILKVLMVFKFVKNIFYKIVEHLDAVNRIPRKRNTYKYLQYALKLLKKYDVVIFGHTHQLEAFKTYFLNNKKRYLNSGTCSLGRFQAVIIDTESLKFDTIKISKENVKMVNKANQKQLLAIYS